MQCAYFTQTHLAKESFPWKIVTESRTSLHNDTVCALLRSKLSCDRSAAGFKPSKVELNVAKKATYKYNQAHKS